MPESKNNFIKGRMNKDLDERLMQPGEYRNAQNVSVSNSESGNSGTVENVLGTKRVANFLSSVRNLECIGYHSDVESARVYLFLTNYTDSSPDTLSNFAPTTTEHYIVCYEKNNDRLYTLVKGNFLNFSKNHSILQVNLIEDLLFWTDNRNQPRKINVISAISNSNQVNTNPYYAKEEHISVAKYYPYNPIKLYKYNTEGKLNTFGHDLISRISTVFLGASIGASTTYTYTVGSGTPVATTSGGGSGAVIEVTTDAGSNVESIVITNGGTGFAAGDTISFFDPVSPFTAEMVVTLTEDDFWIEPTMKDTTSLNLPYYAECNASAWAGGGAGTSGNITSDDVNKDLRNYVGCTMYVLSSDGSMSIPIDQARTIATVAAPTGATYPVTLTGDPITIDATDTIIIGANPYYRAEDVDRISNIRDKFVRFAYRFKYDDNEYSLISPFTQPVFVPKQYGHFLGDANVIDRDEQDSIKSSNVDFFENSITEVELLVDLPEGISNVSELAEDLKVKEVDIIYKDSSEPSVKVVKTIKEDELRTDTSTQLSYTYKSNKPVKVLPESDIVRVSDKIPVRAKAQESVSNRVIYGNYLRAYSSPDILDYSVDYGDKGYQSDYNDAYSRREYPSHQLKLNRTYQVGVVLCDLFGRKSDVITSDDSTVFSKYKDGEFRLIGDTDVYSGDALRIIFNSSIPTSTSDPMYKGVYDADTNPMGWYSYQVVVKQKEQSYQNCYIPSILNGYPKTASDRSGDTAHITLIGDNINKIPRDFESSSEGDGSFSSKAQIYPRVTDLGYSSQHTSELFTGDSSPNKVSIIGLRDDLGLNETEDGSPYTISPFYSVPKVYDRATKPDEENRGGNPLIARISTKEDIGAEGGDAAIPDDISFDLLRLNVVETKPFESNLEIFWETSSAGLISEINEDVLIPENSNGIPYQVSDYSFTFNEANVATDIVSSEFIIQDFSGTDILNASTTGSIVSIKNKYGVSFAGQFSLEKNIVNNKFYLVYNASPAIYYNEFSYLQGNYDIVLEFTNDVSGETKSGRIVLKDNMISNVAPTFTEAETDPITNLGDVSCELSLSNVSLNFAELNTGWREVNDITIGNGSSVDGVFGYSLQDLEYEVTKVEWYNSSTAQWYDYWYIYNSLFEPFRYSREPSGLVKAVFSSDGFYSMKLLYSPILQWRLHDRAIVNVPKTITSTFSNIDSKYQSEEIIVDQATSDLPRFWAKPKSSFNFSTDFSSLQEAFQDSNGVIPADGYVEDSFNQSGVAVMLTNKDTAPPELTTDMPIRVTLSLFDANRNGISKQFQILFDLEKTNYPTRTE